MGQIISDIGSDINSVVSSVTKLVTDVSKALGDLKGIAAGFAPTPPGLTSPYVISFDDASDLQTALKDAMNGAKAATKKLFGSSFTGVTIAGTDVGVVDGYVTGAKSLPCVVAQITQDFGDWQIGANKKTIQDMANTIATNISATLGAVGTAQGHHNLNMNQRVDWTVAYGLFQVSAKSQGLVYAFSAALKSSF